MSNNVKPNEGQILLYQTENGDVKVDVLFKDEVFWATQKTIGQLFGVDRSVVTKHISNIYKDDELDKMATCAKIAQVQKEGNREISRSIDYYSLDVILAVGYRVNSRKATQFRKWATEALKEYIKKGYLLNDEMLKNGKKFGKDYFDELLERIREIRASERRAYQKIADVFEQTSSDYDSSSEETKLFYAFIQNKMHYAVTGQTAAEIIHSRVDSEKMYMGLTTWKNSPDGKILKSDVEIAKNYLNKNEVDLLNRLVVMYIDFAEIRALNQQIMTMKAWLEQTDEFMAYAQKPALKSYGNISKEDALKKAHEEYEKYRIRQDKEFISKFDEELDRYLRGVDNDTNKG